jgi:hypothetical protein
MNNNNYNGSQQNKKQRRRNNRNVTRNKRGNKVKDVVKSKVEYYPPKSDFVSGFQKAIESISFAPRTNGKNYESRRINGNGTISALDRRKIRRSSRAKTAFSQLGFGSSLSADFISWAKGFLDPFSTKQISMPHMPLMVHQPVRNYQSGILTCNGNGFGYIFIKPAYTAVNDKNVCITTSNAATSDNVTAPGTGSQYSMQGPYSTGAVDLSNEQGLQFRIAALGVRIKYTGLVISGAGNAYCIEQEPKKALAAGFEGFSLTDIKANPTFKEYPLTTNEWRSVTRQFLSMKDLSYQGWNSATTGNFAYAEIYEGAPSLDEGMQFGIYISSNSGNQFEWEVVSHLEFVGPNLPTRTITTDDSSHVTKLNGLARNLRQMDNDTIDHAVPSSPQHAAVANLAADKGEAPTTTSFMGFLGDALSVIKPAENILSALF